MGHLLSSLSSSATTQLYNGKSLSRLRVKTDVEPFKEHREVTLSEFLKARCPSLFEPFTPVWFLKNGHLQTLYCVVGDFSTIDRVVYDRTLIRLKDGGTLGLDSTPPVHERTLPDATPIVVVKHGLTGGSHESYVRAVLAQAVKPIEEGGLGYRGIVINFRGCAGVKVTSGQLYSAVHTDDLRQALMYIAHRYPDAPLLGVGFSLGANVMVRYLSEEGEQSRLRAACALGCPWDLLANARRLDNNFFLRNVYSKAMAQNLTNLCKRNYPDIKNLTDTRLKTILDDLYSQKKKFTLTDFDGKVTAAVGGSAPPFPFPNADAYYTYGSSHARLDSIGVPLLAINANDDPVVRHYPSDCGGNALVAVAATKGGGHLGWFENKDGEIRRWVTKPVIEWLRAIVEDYEPTEVTLRPIAKDGEWITEEGRENLGFQVLGDAGEVLGAEGEGGLFAGL